MKRKAHFQRSLASQSSFEKYGRKSKREMFLEQMERVVPWAELEALVLPHYAQAGNGRQPVGLGIMLRTYFVQQWFNLPDPGAEEALYESAVLRRFVGVDLGVAPAPDETTICRFRHLLEKQASWMERRKRSGLARRDKVERFEQIRRECEFGVGSIAGVSRKLGVHRRMVREAWTSAVPAQHKPQQRKLAEARAFIDRILTEDRRSAAKGE